MTPENFLESKNIKRPTYEGVRLVDDKMRDYRIVELLESYHQAKLKLLGIGGVVGRSEQLFCPECSSGQVTIHSKTESRHCLMCGISWGK